MKYLVVYCLLVSFNTLTQTPQRAICIDFVGSKDTGWVVKQCYLTDTNFTNFYNLAIKKSEIVAFNSISNRNFGELQKLFDLFLIDKNADFYWNHFTIDFLNDNKIAQAKMAFESPFFTYFFCQIAYSNPINDSIIDNLKKLYFEKTEQTANKVIGNFEFHSMEGGSVGKKYYLTIKANGEYLLSGDNPFEFSYIGAGKWQASGDLLILDEINSRKKNPSDPLVFDPISSQLIFYRDGKKYIGTFMK